MDANVSNVNILILFKKKNIFNMKELYVNHYQLIFLI